ncbi:MAG: 3-deoxy-7-phosphoheptulonate synthase [Oscillospiraceae bacterium]|nr:3-deoxy-7-phosphoheptulonate synthase [Oscillospiraceae bacterium]
MNMEFERKLTIPMEVKKMYPVSAEMQKNVEARAKVLEDIFSGRDDRIVLIIGPCSADNPDSVLDYISRLRKVQEQVADKVFIVPRIYTNKPRTTGSGYKGLLHQPNPTEKPDMFKGILATRALHMRALQETGFSCADEMLYPENHRYVDDLLAYVAVGARSVENQEHRLVASGIPIPVGMKNPTGGDLSVMMNAITAAQRGHTFIYRGWEVHSQGNQYAHAILRGYMNKHGQSLPNYHYEDLAQLAALYAAGDYQNPAAIIDTNHANSGKNPFEQTRIAMEVLHARRHNDDIKRLVKGFMIESYIEDGAQKPDGGCYGKSITDPCLGWEKSERLILDIADSL